MSGIAVVIPVWNRAETLARAIESALSQQPDELVIVDDASTDESAEVARQYPVRFVQHPAKTDNWIQALEPVHRSLTSDYVIQMGADDVLYAGCVRNIREVLDSSKAFAWPGVVFGDYEWLREGNPLAATKLCRHGLPGITAMSPTQAQKWFQESEAARHESGVGSAIRRDLLLWLFYEECWRLGPWADSFGYVVAALRGGVIYIPQVHAGVVGLQAKPSYHQEISRNAERRQPYIEAAIEWFSRPAIAPLVRGIEFRI